MSCIKHQMIDALRTKYEGDLVGVDLLPAKNRDVAQPYILEVNGTPGLGGIDEVTKGKSVTQEIFKTYLN